MATDVLGKLRVLLGLESDTFVKGLKKSNDATKKFAKTTKRETDKVKKSFKSTDKGIGKVVGMLKGLNTAIAGLAVVAGARLFKTMITDSLDLADSIAKVSGKIGITTDQLQELRFAADLSGVDLKVFDKALQNFVRQVSEAARGTGEAKDAFEILGISFKDANGNLKDSIDILEEVADGLNGLKDNADKLGVAFDLFGGRGAGLLNLLKDGSEGIKKLRKEARSLGIVLDKDLIKRAVESKDKLTALTTVIKTDLTESFLTLTPILLGLTKGIKEITTGFGDLARIRKNFLAGDPLSLGVRGSVDLGFGRARPEITELKELSATLEKEVIATRQKLSKLLESPIAKEKLSFTGIVEDDISSLKKATEDARKDFEKAINKIPKLLQGVVRAMSTPFRTLVNDLEGGIESIDAKSKKLKEIQERILGVTKAPQVAEGDSFITAVQQFEEATKKEIEFLKSTGAERERLILQRKIDIAVMREANKAVRQGQTLDKAGKEDIARIVTQREALIASLAEEEKHRKNLQRISTEQRRSIASDIKGLSSVIDEEAAAFKKEIDIRNDVSGAIREQTSLTKLESLAIKGEIDNIEDLISNLRESFKIRNRLSKEALQIQQTDEIKESLKSQNELLQEQIDLTQDLVGANIENALTQEEANKKIALLRKEFDNTTSVIEDGIKEAKEVFSVALADMLVEGDFTFKALGASFLKNFISKLLQFGFTNFFFGPTGGNAATNPIPVNPPTGTFNPTGGLAFQANVEESFKKLQVQENEVNIKVEVINNAGVNVEVSKPQRTGNTDIFKIMLSKVRQDFAEGGFDSIMQSGFATTRVGR